MLNTYINKKSQNSMHISLKKFNYNFIIINIVFFTDFKIHFTALSIRASCKFDINENIMRMGWPD